ncbi:calcium channel protein [Mortierella sp. NVP85]|nr:calcium channel protein [Mortierella sp. NVP85]
MGTPSHHQPQPPVPDIPSIFQQPAQEEEQEARASDDDGNTATVGQPADDQSTGSRTPLALQPETVYYQQERIDPPLEGRSLFIFGTENPLRKKLNRFLNQPLVELFMLLLLLLNLIFLITVVSSPLGNDTIWGGHWTDYGILAIFVIYTLEISARIIVSGLIIYPKDGEKIRKFFGKKPRTDNLHDTNPTILRKQATMAQATTPKESEKPVPGRSRAEFRRTTIIDFAVGRPTGISQHLPTYIDPLIEFKPQFVESKAQIPFLRHTFNRIDMVAVVAYWIDFGLMMAGVQGVYVFKALAAIRTLRLLNITSGSSTILHSLKRSAPLLANIVLFIAFFFIIFSIIGVQSFKGSFSRRCVLATNYTEVLDDQFCGGHYNASDPKGKSSYIKMDGNRSRTAAKGYTCSQGYVCKDTGVNFDGAISFDNIYSAMVPVYVLMTGQTWTDMMYKIMDAEYSWSSVYFVLVILIMNFWILNLFVAVINEMFAKIRDDSSNNSAFKSSSGDATENAKDASSKDDKEKDGMENKEGAGNNDILMQSVANFTYADDTINQRKRDKIDRLEFFWVVIVIADLVIQSMPQYRSSPTQVLLYNRAELGFTAAFAVDVGIRFMIWMPTPKEFFKSKKNNVDLFLAITTLIIQIPPIRNSRVYVYLTVFQVLRVYRPIIYIERLRFLIVSVNYNRIFEV